MKRSFDFPIIAVTIFLTGSSMFGPALAALIADEHSTSRVFFYTGLLIIVFSVIAGLSVLNFRPNISYTDQLFGLVLIFIFLPGLLAVPLSEIFESVPYSDLYFDMVSCLTTTGATIVDLPAQTGHSIAIWRAEVGWLGGYLIWVAAAAILEPLSLGGFEVGKRGESAPAGAPINEGKQIRQRIRWHNFILFPWYFGATALLWGLEIIAGEEPISGLVMAMSTISTSGITLQGGPGLAGEAVVFVFLILALSSLFVTERRAAFRIGRLVRDSELRIAFLLLAGAVATVILANLPHLITSRSLDDAAGAILALWGAIYTATSYLATAGFDSVSLAPDVSPPGFRLSGFMLILLAVCGGGIATTAGGLKLIRILAMIRLSDQELSRLVYPSTVATSVGIARSAKVSGQEFAWIACMVFLLLIAFFVLALAATGLSFRDAAVVSAAAMSTTGPLAGAVLGDQFAYAELNLVAKSLIASAMIFGRLEILTVIAIFNPALWRSQNR